MITLKIYVQATPNDETSITHLQAIYNVTEVMINHSQSIQYKTAGDNTWKRIDHSLYTGMTVESVNTMEAVGVSFASPNWIEKINYFILKSV